MTACYPCRTWPTEGVNDPPFNSNRDDNVVFRDESGKTCDAQLLAFEDA